MFDATYAGRRVTGAAAGERLQRDQRLDTHEQPRPNALTCNVRAATPGAPSHSRLLKVNVARTRLPSVRFRS